MPRVPQELFTVPFVDGADSENRTLRSGKLELPSIHWFGLLCCTKEVVYVQSYKCRDWCIYSFVCEVRKTKY